MWVSRATYGPSIKFLVQNVHTMAETKLIGNCLKVNTQILPTLPCSLSLSAGQFNHNYFKEKFTDTSSFPLFSFARDPAPSCSLTRTSTALLLIDS